MSIENILVPEPRMENKLPPVFNGLRIEAISVRELLFPCHAFTVSIMKQKQSASALNIFERTILSLTQYYTKDARRIAELMGFFHKEKDGRECADTDLVLFIQKKLFERGYLTDRYEFLENNDVMDSTKSDAPPSFSTVTVFRELITGKLLQHFVWDIPEYIQGWKNGEIVEFRYGTEGKKEKRECIRIDKKISNKKAPLPMEIVSIGAGYLNDNGKIVIQPNVKLVYINACAANQVGRPDYWIASDGFNSDLSDIFSDIVNNELMDEIFHRKYEKKNDYKENNKRNEEESELVKVFSGYPEIKDLMKRIEKKLNEVHDANTNTAEKKQASIRGNILKNLYSAFELALYYCCKNYHYVPKVIKSLEAYISKGSELLIAEVANEDLAKPLGFIITKQETSFLQTSSNAIRRFRTSMERSSVSSEMAAGLIFALAVALDNAAHPIRKIARQYPDALRTLHELKPYRDMEAHLELQSISKETIDTFSERIRKFLEILLNITIPEFKKVNNEGDENKINDDNWNREIEDEEINAIAKLQELVGLDLWQNICHNHRTLSEKCIEIQLEGENTQIEHIAALLEGTYRILIAKFLRNTKIVSHDDLLIKAHQQVLSAGFKENNVLFGEHGPRSDNIIKSLEGQGKTLGANCCAFLLLADKDTLRLVAEELPLLIELTGELVTERDHGNKILRTTQLVTKRKEDVFEAMKILMRKFI